MQAVTINIEKLIPTYDWTEGGTSFQEFMILYQDFINTIVSANVSIYDLFDIWECDDRFLPYISEFLGYTWDYNKDNTTQRAHLASIVDRNKRLGTFWCIDDYLRFYDVAANVRYLVHNVLYLSSSGELSEDYYIQGKTKYHEGSVEILISDSSVVSPITLEEDLRSLIPAGIHLHISYSS